MRKLLVLWLLLASWPAAAQVAGRVHTATDLANGRRLAAWTRTQLHVREATGRNDGPEVEAYQRATGNSRGAFWCACYQGYGNLVFKLPIPPAGGAARNWDKPGRTFYKRGRFGSLDSMATGDRTMFYYGNLGRIGHIGMALEPGRSKRKGRPARGWTTNEGNTGSGGGRNGAGVHDLFHASPDFYATANWSHK